MNIDRFFLIESLALPNVSPLALIVLLGHVCKQVKKVNSLQVGLLASK